MCSNRSLSSYDTISLFVNDTGTLTRDCFCEMTSNYGINMGLYLYSYTCPQCRIDRPRPTYCTSDFCLGGGVNLTNSPSCITVDNKICRLAFSTTYYSCQPLRKFTLTLSMEQSPRCSNLKNSENLPFRIQLLASSKCHYGDVKS